MRVGKFDLVELVKGEELSTGIMVLDFRLKLGASSYVEAASRGPRKQVSPSSLHVPMIKVVSKKSKH